MCKVLAKNPQVEQQRLHRRIFLDNIDSENQALMIMVSCFVKTSHFEEYLCVKEAILLDLLRVVSHHRARLATPIQTYQKIYSDADMENIPFSDTIFDRGGAATQSRFLLIELSYKISSDDETKSQARTPRVNEEKDIKDAGASTSDSNADDEATASPDSEPSESKPDNKVTETASSESKAATLPNLKEREVPESKADTKVAVRSSSDAEADPEVAATLHDLNDRKPAFDEFVQKNSDEQSKNLSSGDATKYSKLGSAPSATNTPVSEPQLKLEGTDSRALNSKDSNLSEPAFKKPPVSLLESLPSATSHTKKESKRSPSVARSPLEDNIVLGVALEGSKRTLPIEEELAPPTPVQTKELAACHNANRSLPTSGKDDSGQIPAGPVDQRDQER